MKNFVCEGKKIEVTVAADTASGEVVKAGTIISVAAHSGKSGEKVVCDRVGVFELAKKADDVITQGVLLYWDAVAKNLTITAGGNTLAGPAYEAAAGATTLAKVILG